MRLQEIIRRAIEIGSRTGSITFDQLNELCDGNRKLEPEEIEAVMAALSDERISIREEDSQSPHLSCSFCGKPQPEVLQLIAGPNSFICNECVKLCVQCIASDHPQWSAELRKLLDNLIGKNRQA